MRKEKTVRTYQRRTKSGKMVTVREHKASYDAAEEIRKAAAKKAGAGSELSKKRAIKEESPLGFSEADYKEWYHWDMEDDANNEAALRVEKALTKKMGKRAYNKYLEDMSNSYSARGHKKAHQALLDEHTASQKKQDVESAKTAKDIARGAKDSSKSSTTPKKKETKGDRAVARMNKMVNEALSSTTSDPKTLKKQLKALIDYNGGPVNRGDKIGKRIDEIREQLGKRSSKKRVDKKTDYDYETSMKNLENYFAEERRKSTSKGKTTKTKKAEPKTSTTGAGADWSKATVDKIGREYGGGYTIVGTPNDSLWSSTNFRTKSQALDFIKRKQKEASAKGKESSKKSPKISGGAPTSADLRKQADEMDAREKKAKIAEKVGKRYKTIKNARLNNPAPNSRGATLRGNVYISSDGTIAYYEDPTNKGKLKKASAALLRRLTDKKKSDSGIRTTDRTKSSIPTASSKIVTKHLRSKLDTFGSLWTDKGKYYVDFKDDGLLRVTASQYRSLLEKKKAKTKTL